MRRLLLIANPSASGFTGAMHRGVVQELKTAFEVVPAWPSSPEAARQMAAEAAFDGFHVVAAMGGDGVVHHVANGIARTRTALAVIPAGTTNVVARVLGLPSTPAKAAAAMATGKVTTVPLAHLTTEGGTAAGSEYAVFAAGIGYDAEMVRIAEQRPSSKLYFGSIHYARSAASALLGRYRTRPPNLRIECDGRRVDAVTVMVQVHDPYTYFGKLALRLSPDPGPGLTVMAIESLALPRAMAVLARAGTARAVEAVPGIHVWHDPAKLVIEADPPTLFQADGELLGSTDWLEVTPEMEGLRVLVPPKAKGRT